MKLCFWVQSVRLITSAGDGRHAEVILQAKYRTDGTNIEWSKYTPVGEMKFIVTQPEAVTYWLDRLGKDQLFTASDIGPDSGVVSA